MDDTETAVPVNAIRHGFCDGWWTGPTRAHCSGCCRTFSCDSAASRHRVGAFGEDRRCAAPESVGLVAKQLAFGALWSWPAPEAGADSRRGGES
jgi:hypothetical protein